jgi:hypothetical protein
MHTSSSVYQFSDLANAGFTALEYSKLKFGSDSVARKFGYELAKDFFEKYSDVLLSNRCVVIPSPYNHVENAATVMTKHFVNKLNELLVLANGEHVEYSVIHRKISYISDYGFLSKDKRRNLINGDSFFLNKDFYKDKVLIFVDDVCITGTHEDKLKDILHKEGITNDCFFLYFAKYLGNNASIEAELNFAGIKHVDDYLRLAREPNHNVIVRPIKFLLGQQDVKLFETAIHELPMAYRLKIYHGALGEGYYKVPGYQRNFHVLMQMVE